MGQQVERVFDASRALQRTRIDRHAQGLRQLARVERLAWPSPIRRCVPARGDPGRRRSAVRETPATRLAKTAAPRHPGTPAPSAPADRRRSTRSSRRRKCPGIPARASPWPSSRADAPLSRHLSCGTWRPTRLETRHRTTRADAAAETRGASGPDPRRFNRNCSCLVGATGGVQRAIVICMPPRADGPRAHQITDRTICRIERSDHSHQLN